jgi:hypothetical protein
MSFNRTETVVRAKIDALEDLKSKSYGIQIESSFAGVVDVSEIDKELKRLYKKLEVLYDEESER